MTRNGDDTQLDVALQHARWRHFGWAVFWLLLGGLLAVRTGGVGRWLGLVILVGGVRAGWAFVRTLLYPAGRLRLRGDVLELAPQPCAGADVRVPLGELRHAYLVRRHVPWMTTGPLLVVETARGTWEYPRDWFATEQDQRRVVVVLNRRLGRLA